VLQLEAYLPSQELNCDQLANDFLEILTNDENYEANLDYFDARKENY
jgi:hypothetical protein